MHSKEFRISSNMDGNAKTSLKGSGLSYKTRALNLKISRKDKIDYFVVLKLRLTVKYAQKITLKLFNKYGNLIEEKQVGFYSFKLYNHM